MKPRLGRASERGAIHILSRAEGAARPSQKDEDSFEGGKPCAAKHGPGHWNKFQEWNRDCEVQEACQEEIVHEWHETICVTLDENKKENACAILSLCYFLNSWTQ